jgi:hypothetical protein
VNEQRIEQELRDYFKAEAKKAEPSSEWWDNAILQLGRRVLVPSFRERLGSILVKPVWRAAIPVVTVLIVIGALLGTGVLPWLQGGEGPGPASTPTPPAITFAPGSAGTASWASSWENLGELCNTSDLIVVGTVDRVIEMVRAEWGPDFVYDARSAFKIDSVLKGKTGKEIVLSHMALAIPNGWMEGMAEDPPVEAGERWVFFLRRTDSGTYSNMGPWGRYKIIDDKVYSMNRVMGDNDAYIAAGGELDFNGVDLTDFIDRVTRTLDSVVLTFNDARHHELPARAVRFDAGGFQEVDIELATGEHGPDTLTYTVRRVAGKDSTIVLPLPDGLEVMIAPAQFTAQPRNQYQSTLKIFTRPDLASGTYWIRVEYQLGESVSGFRVLMVNINPLETAGAD